ncbi:Galectin-3 [Frankliniella fusca]|uniref:Galectin-3 n=1 Tax=Frankliniella fusca TaxID=407009 RepID=A0AAE1LP67_9NEOP|nr:Galectin-3 [Frankliniella fusca]
MGVGSKSYKRKSLGIRGKKIRQQLRILSESRWSKAQGVASRCGAQPEAQPDFQPPRDVPASPPPAHPAPGSPAGQQQERPASPVTPRAAPGPSAGPASPSAGEPAGPRARPAPEGAAASTPVRRADVFDFNASSVSPIGREAWRPQVAPLRELPVFSAAKHRKNLVAGEITKCKPLPPPEGRRLFLDSEFVGETLLGFRSIMYYQCQLCYKIIKLDTDGPNSDLNINMSMVLGTVEAGSTFMAVRTLGAAINMPTPTKKTYARYEDTLRDSMEDVTFARMIDAGRREREHAMKIKNFCKDGIPYIIGERISIRTPSKPGRPFHGFQPVYEWPFANLQVYSRWHVGQTFVQNKYDATSGTLTVIGLFTGEVLWVSTKNKRCAVCEFADRKQIPKREHKCARNYKGPSTGMEAALAVEAFLSSMEMHGVRFMQYIGDGDSSVEKSLQATMPYGAEFLIQKIECKNHIMRNLRRSLIDTTGNTHIPCPGDVTKNEMVTLRKVLRERVLRLSKGISVACVYRGQKEKVPQHHMRVSRLRQDILNSPRHVFGDHRKCDVYFCKAKKALASDGAKEVPASLSTSAAPSTFAAAPSTSAAYSTTLEKLM